jgi:hypothetical protein
MIRLRDGGFQSNNGSGNSSGLGEFWNKELAKNAAFSMLVMFIVDRSATPARTPGLEGVVMFISVGLLADGLKRPFMLELRLPLSIAPRPDGASSSEDMWKTPPSLGVRRCFLFRDLSPFFLFCGEGEESGTGKEIGRKVPVEMGADRKGAPS